MNFRDIDLNLLVAFDALMVERSVTRAAARVGLSQPAMSNALARLRTMFDDQLFVRGAGGMVPTPRAMELAKPVREALGLIDRALHAKTDFDPETSARTFRVATTDYVGYVLLPQLIRRLTIEAPEVELIVVPLEHRLPREDLEEGRLDIALGTFPRIPDTLHSKELFEERFQCVVRKDHPQVGDNLDLDTFVRLEHLMVSARGRVPGPVDYALADLGLKRRVAVCVPHFVHAPRAIAASDLVTTLPEQVATNHAQTLPIRVFPPPVELPAFPIVMAWHERTHHSMGTRWFRDLVASLVKDAAGTD